MKSAFIYIILFVGCHEYISMIPAYIDNNVWVLKWPPAGDCFVNFTLYTCTADDQNCQSQITLTPGNVTGECVYALTFLQQHIYLITISSNFLTIHSFASI